MTLRTILGTSTFLALTLALAGCGGGSGAPGASGSNASSSAAATVSKYDAGPRAGEQPINQDLVEAGEKLFKDKGCSACHAFGAQLSGPDLRGVSMRRTALWMENQILHPEVMVKEDPISHTMFAKYALQMTNLHLTPAEARTLIEYLKHQDHEQSEVH